VEKRIGRISLEQKNDTATPEFLIRAARERLLAGGLDLLPWSATARRFLNRCRFVQQGGARPGWPDLSPEALLASVNEWLFPFGRWDGGGAVFTEASLTEAVRGLLGWEGCRALEALAPETLTLPSGSVKRIDYETADGPVLAARLQEFFGCRQTPQVGGRPVTLHLLSPAGRPVQITRDLDGFWERSYPEVKKELMGRYPRHPWPEDPRSALPTSRTKRRSIK
jgi:ATP-dependent helicase HrpB